MHILHGILIAIKVHVYKFGNLPGFSKMFLDFPAFSKVYRPDSPAVAAQVWPPWLPTTAMAPAAATIPGRARHAGRKLLQRFCQNCLKGTFILW